MRKFFICFVALLTMVAAATEPARAQSNTVTWTNYNMPEFDLSSQGDRQTTDDVTITSNGGSAGDNDGNIFFNGAFTFSVPVGSVLTQIVIRDDTWLGVDDNNTGWSRDEHQTQATWTGSARSVACQINASHVQYFEFTIAPAVPKMYTSEVSITVLVPGDTLAEGATIIGSGNDYDMVFLGAGRTKENGVVQSFWTDLGLPPTVIGTNGTISKTYTYTPVDENGQDGNAWVVSSAILNYDDGFQVGLDGITIPVTLDSIPADWTVKVAGVTQTLQTYDGGNPNMRWLEIPETDIVKLLPPAELKSTIKSVTLKEASAEPVLLTTIMSNANASFTNGSMTFDNIATVTFSGAVSNSGDWGWYHTNGTTLTVTPVEGIVITRVKFTCDAGSVFDSIAPFEAVLGEGDPWYNPYTFVNGNKCGENGVTQIEVYGYQDLEATRDADSNWTFAMPNNDALVSITYKDSAHLAWTYNSAAMPAEGLTAYRGFELPVIGGIGASMDHDFLTALLGGTVSLRYGSVNGVVSFTDANDIQSFRVNGAGLDTVYMVFGGNDDYQYDSAWFTVNIQTPPLLTLDVNNSEWGSVRLPFEGNIPEQLPDPEPTVVATPVISGELLFTDSVIVTMSCATSEADIYYTNDGSTNPKCDCPAAPEYKHPIVLKETTTIKAAAYTGNDWSAVATMTFTKVTLPDGVAYVNDSTFSVLPGTEVKVIATPTDSTYFVNWDEETALNSNTAVEKTLTMGTAPATLTANFAAKPTLTLAVNDTSWGKVTIEGAGSAGGAGGDVTIGDSTSTSVSANLPGYTLYDYAYSQQIYTADEIGLSGDITSLTMWLKNSSSYARNLEVYMKEVDRSAFADNTDWELLTSDNLVASGTMDNGISTPVNYTFNLTTPFHYSGTGNLLLCIRDVSGQWSSGLGGVTMDATGNQSIYAYRDNTVYDITTPITSGDRHVASVKNAIKLGITPAAGSNSGVVKIDSVTYRVDYGTEVTVNAQATELHHVQGWDNGNGTELATATYSNYFVFADPDSLFPAKSALTFTMTNDTTVRALFGLNSYDVTARATVDSREVIGTDTAMGVIACVSYLDIQGNPQTVAPDSVITYTAQGGSTSKLVAQPYYGYLFKHWQVGDDVYLQDTLTLTAATEVVAVFVPDTFSFATTTNNFRWGTVEADADGRYPYLSQMTLEAVPTIGNHFVEWSDGDTNIVRTVSLTQDTNLTAIFARTYYTVTYNPSEEGRGTISCEHPNPFQSNYGYTTHMKATAEYGYHFVRWQNAAGTAVLGLQDSIDIVVTKDTAIVAVFELNSYLVTAQSESAAKGSVTGSGNYLYLSEATLTATAKNGYHFTQWNDGDTLNPRTVEVLADATYTAQFAKNLYTVTVVSADTAMGTASGTATVEYESSVQLTATANEHYHFAQWQDGNKQNPRSYTVTGDKTMTAKFAPDQYVVKGVADQGRGSVTGSGTYDYLTNVTLTAVPTCGFVFDHWSDNSTSGTITVTATEDVTLTAYFRAVAVDTVEVHDTIEYHDTTVVALDTMYINVPDTTLVPVTLYDTTTVDVTMYDTTVVDITMYDTTSVPIQVFDTVIVPVTIVDTTLAPVVVYDTTVIDVTLYDTTNVAVTVYDTTSVPVTVYDTTNVPVTVYDTTTVPVTVYDTTVTTVPVTVYDTTTVPVTVIDTTIVPVTEYDTTHVAVIVVDSTLVPVYDTIWLTEYIRDTVYIEVHDTVYIHDTIFVGIDEVETLDAKIYANNGQIVVEGADGNKVVLYDVTGRILATKVDEYAPLRFDIPVSGTYLVKIGNHAARRIVMIR